MKRLAAAAASLCAAAAFALDCTDLSLLSRKTEYTLDTATGGIDGLPEFDEDANKGWHLVKTTENGVESLKFFWKLGMKIVVH